MTDVDRRVLVGRDYLPVVVASTTLVATALWLGVGRMLDAPPAPMRLSWPLLAVAFAVVEATIVHIEFRDETHAFTLSEVPLILGLVFTGPAGVVLARVLGSSLALVVWWRQPARKLATNTAAFAAEAVVAVVAYDVLRGSATVLTPRGWAAAIGAALLGSVVSHTSVLAAIRATTGRLEAEALRALRGAAPLVTVANCCAGLLAAILVWRDAGAAWLLLAVGGLLLGAHRSHTRLRRRYADLDRVHRFTQGLQTATSGVDALRAVLVQTADVLRANRAELLVGTDAGIRRIALDGERTTPDVDRALDREVALGEGFVWHAGDAASDGARAWLLPDGARDGVVAPVHVPGEQSACALIVADHIGAVGTFDDDDLTVLRTVANHAATALGSGRLLDRLRREIAEKEFIARHDALTELVNRLAFSEALADMAQRPDGAAVVLLDLDGFKEINDALGHAVGDEFLLASARHLVGAAPGGSVVARLGGDEFAIAMPGVPDLDRAMDAGVRLLAAVAQPLEVAGAQLAVTATAGVAVAPLHGRDPEVLLQRADVAMYTAQREHVRIRAYEPEHDADAAERLALIADLRDAIEGGDLELHYQPKVAVSGLALRGVEALVRWQHPEHGFLPPARFVALAEHAGLVRSLSSWVMREAVTQLAAWRRAGLDIPVAINLSPRDISDPTIVPEVRELLRTFDVPAGALTIEITESSVLDDVDRSMDVLHELAALGVHLAVDDFGTGYSSLAHVKNLPIDEVKIDRAFVSSLVDDPVDGAIVAAVLQLAAELRLNVVAEGVEDEATLTRLDALGCDVAQGFHMSRPMPAHDVEAWARSWPAGLARPVLRPPGP